MAEVLITLGIIGVVAAITTPTLISEHKKKVTVARLKSNFSILSQAINASKLENGDINTWDTTLSSEEFAEIYIIPYLKGAQKLNNKYLLRAIDKKTSFFCWNNPLYLLPNGSAIYVNPNSQNAIRLILDINGKQAPNVVGIDAFELVISPTNNILIPTCNSYSKEQIKNATYGACRKDKTGVYGGECCAALIMKDGWEITEDYPW